MLYNQNKTNYRTLFAEIKQISICFKSLLTNTFMSSMKSFIVRLIVEQRTS